MELPPILANSIWAGSFPYGFQFFGLHVFAELPLEAYVIWRFIQRREGFGWLFGRVLLANVASFFAGTFGLTGFPIPMHSLGGTAGVWLGAFLVSWAVEGFLLRRWLQMVPTATVWRATFWGNVASYTIAALIFIAWLRGIRVPWHMYFR
ncbi:MAG: hypothetical protein ABL962_20195 [Fimbriimonadaceae bacterium]